MPPNCEISLQSGFLQNIFKIGQYRSQLMIVILADRLSSIKFTPAGKVPMLYKESNGVVKGCTSQNRTLLVQHQELCFAEQFLKGINHQVVHDNTR